MGYYIRLQSRLMRLYNPHTLLFSRASGAATPLALFFWARSLVSPEYH